jgi:uncharacterized protein
MSDLNITWEEYHQSIEQLAEKIVPWEFNQIVCIARGGLRVGDILSRIFDRPLAILATSSYGNRERGDLTIANHMTMTGETLGDRVLLVDDLVDSGITLEQTASWLRDRHPEIQELKTAVVWYKAQSISVPDYYASYLTENVWIHQPFEKYDLRRQYYAKRSSPRRELREVKSE